MNRSCCVRDSGPGQNPDGRGTCLANSQGAGPQCTRPDGHRRGCLDSSGPRRADEGPRVRRSQIGAEKWQAEKRGASVLGQVRDRLTGASTGVR